MSWVDKNWKPLTVVGGLLGLSWFAGKRFEEAETFDADTIRGRWTTKTIDGVSLRRIGKGHLEARYKGIEANIMNWGRKLPGTNTTYWLYWLNAKNEKGEWFGRQVWSENLYGNGLEAIRGFKKDIDNGSLQKRIDDAVKNTYNWKNAETFDAERIKYDFIVHREPKGTKIGKDGKRIPNPKGGWFKSVKGAETFEAYDSMMQNRIDRNECSHSYDEGDSRGGDAWVLKYADLMGVEDGMSYIEAGVKCGICGQERIGSWGINEREGFQITKGEEGRMPRVYGWGYYGAETFNTEEGKKCIWISQELGAYCKKCNKYEGLKDDENYYMLIERIKDNVCLGAETFEAEKSVHQLIIHDGVFSDTYVYENENQIKEALYDDFYGGENLLGEEGYVDSDDAEEDNKKLFMEKTKNMSINDTIDYLQLDMMYYEKSTLDLDKDFIVDGENGGIKQGHKKYGAETKRKE
jgi:hypothetical protein